MFYSSSFPSLFLFFNIVAARSKFLTHSLPEFYGGTGLFVGYILSDLPVFYSLSYLRLIHRPAKCLFISHALTEILELVWDHLEFRIMKYNSYVGAPNLINIILAYLLEISWGPMIYRYSLFDFIKFFYLYCASTITELQCGNSTGWSCSFFMVDFHKSLAFHGHYNLNT